MQTFYKLLSLKPTASADEIKKAFRAEIARYHPDKVQHLGTEFQEMAATRAAQLTEAYRTLMNPELRSEYDRLHAAGEAPSAAPPAPDPGQPHAAPRMSSEPEPPQGPPANAAVNPPPRFAKEHATRDQFVKKATLARIRQVVAAEHGGVVELSTKGFDFHCMSKSKKLFGWGGGQRLAVRFVPTVDRTAIQDTWAAALKAGGDVCVLLMGNGMAGARELADAIADMRKKSRGESGVCIIPVDLRDWSAHVPADAPRTCKNVLQRLRDVSA